jgi:hypothetical protein
VFLRTPSGAGRQPLIGCALVTSPPSAGPSLLKLERTNDQVLERDPSRPVQRLPAFRLVPEIGQFLDRREGLDLRLPLIVGHERCPSGGLVCGAVSISPGDHVGQPNNCPPCYRSCDRFFWSGLFSAESVVEA